MKPYTQGKPITYVVAGLAVASALLPNPEDQSKLLNSLFTGKKEVIVYRYPEAKTLRQKIAKWIGGY